MRTSPPTREDWLRYIYLHEHPDSPPGLPWIPGSHHQQYRRAAREPRRWRPPASAREGHGLRGLTSKDMAGNCGWVIAANIAVTSPPGPRSRPPRRPGPGDADPDTSDKVLAPPARLARHARQPHPRHKSRWPWGQPGPSGAGSGSPPASTRMTSRNTRTTRKEDQAGAVGAGCRPAHGGNPAHPATSTETAIRIKTESSNSVTGPRPA